VSTLNSSALILRTLQLHVAVHTCKFVIIKAKPIDNANNTQLMEQSMLQQMRGSLFCLPACQSDASLVRPQNKSQNRPSEQPAQKSYKEGTLLYGTNTFVDQTKGTIPLKPPHQCFLFIYLFVFYLKFNVPKTETTSIYWTQLIMFHLKTEAESSLRNVASTDPICKIMHVDFPC
jgi:hypothetical protein